MINFCEVIAWLSLPITYVMFCETRRRYSLKWLLGLMAATAIFLGSASVVIRAWNNS